MPNIEALANKLSTYLDDEQINLVRRAYFYAEQAHDGQKRRSGEAYVTHPLAVALILADMHIDHQSLIAAVLHDVIEDTAIEKKALTAQFGVAVSELVDGVSKLTQMQFETKAEAQAENFQKMAMAMARDLRVILVKLADRLHNMRTLDVLSFEKRHRIAKETLEIYAPIANRLGMNNIRIELEDLCFKSMHPMRSTHIRAAVQKARGNRSEIVQHIEESLINCLQNEGINSTISGREKHLYSIYRKMKEKRRAFSEVMDVYAFRIVVNKVDTCYRVLGAVHNLYKPVPGRFKDYIAIPKANGYQSLHTTLFGMHGVPIEIQIRTQEMEEMASNGIAAHWLYKSKTENQPADSHIRARQWVKGILEMQQRAGNSLEFIENVKTDLFPDEVYVFTPTGRIMALPLRSTPIDFAYAVHTDIGNTCIACRINRHLAPLSQPLESGSTVEIITTASARPSPAWLNFIVTGKARAHIRHALKQQQRNESIQLGHRLLNKTLNSFNATVEGMTLEQIQPTLSKYKHLSLDDLLEGIGLGNRIASVVAQHLTSSEENIQNEHPLSILGTEGLSLNYAKCCSPIPGDPIVGHLSAGKGMVVHTANCRNIKEARHNPEKCIILNWDPNIKDGFGVDIRIEVKHKRGVIARLAGCVNDADSSIDKINMNERNEFINIIQITVNVKNRVHLANIIKKLRLIPSVIRITRVHNS
ncbi:UNVERIFIED_CONTAM: hypothetical protein GTU68_035388 [Idotea baltica]|nr:hypothetical protein [Idotea baltica]